MLFLKLKYLLYYYKSLERWPSGLRRTLGKCVYPHRYRGFESHSLRHLFQLIKLFNLSISILKKPKSGEIVCVSLFRLRDL